MDIRRLLSEKAERHALLGEEVASITAQLKALGAKKIILFGSFARDEAGVHSDLDFIVVMPGEQGFAYWSHRLYDEIVRRVAVDFLPYNEREFAEVSRHSRTVRHALRTGKVLYERSD
jgi:predicted nucleotidyltransferase